MINPEISGTLPQLQPTENIMAKLAQMLGEDIEQDRLAGGNPPWRQRIYPPGQALLTYINRTLKTSYGENFAQANWGSGDSSKYAKVHELGWSIPRTAGTRGHFWKLWYESGKTIDFYKNMAISKNAFINMPRRAIFFGIFGRLKEYAEFLSRELTITQSIPLSTFKKG